MNPKFLAKGLGSVSWSSNNIENRSLNFTIFFLESMMINLVLLGFRFRFGFVIQVKTSLTQVSNQLMILKLQNRIEISKCVCHRHRDDALHHAYINCIRHTILNFYLFTQVRCKPVKSCTRNSIPR